MKGKNEKGYTLWLWIRICGLWLVDCGLRWLYGWVYDGLDYVLLLASCLMRLGLVFSMGFLQVCDTGKIELEMVFLCRSFWFHSPSLYVQIRVPFNQFQILILVTYSILIKSAMNGIKGLNAFWSWERQETSDFCDVLWLWRCREIFSDPMGKELDSLDIN